jgi:hypothetical protein
MRAPGLFGAPKHFLLSQWHPDKECLKVLNVIISR